MKNKILLFVIVSVTQQGFCTEKKLSTIGWLGQEIKEFGYNLWTGRVKHHAKEKYATNKNSNNSYVSVYKDSEKQWRLVENHKAIFLENEKDSVIYFGKLYEYLKVVQKHISKAKERLEAIKKSEKNNENKNVHYTVRVTIPLEENEKKELREITINSLRELCSYDTEAKDLISQDEILGEEKIEKATDENMYESLKKFADIRWKNRGQTWYNFISYAQLLGYTNKILTESNVEMDVNHFPDDLCILSVQQEEKKRVCYNSFFGDKQFLLQMFDDQKKEITLRDPEGSGGSTVTYEKKDLILSSWIKPNSLYYYYTYEWINAARIKAAVGLVTLATVSVGYLWAVRKLKNISKNQADSI